MDCFNCSGKGNELCFSTFSVSSSYDVCLHVCDVYDSKGGLISWIWRCFQEESGPNGKNDVLLVLYLWCLVEKVKRLFECLVTGAGAVEGVGYVNALAVLALESTDTLWVSGS